MGGDNSPENLVSLPVDIHYIVHFLLPFVYEERGDVEGRKKMTFAFSLFSHKSLITQGCVDLVQQSQEYAKLKSTASDFSRQLQKELYADEQYKSMMIAKHKAAQQTEEYKKKHHAGVLLRNQSKSWKEHHAAGQRRRFARQEERELQRQRKLGKPMSSEARRHMSESQRKRYENPEERYKGAHYGKNNGMYGRRGENSIPHQMRWIKNDMTGESRYVWKSEPIPEGWTLGRCKINHT